MSKNESQIILKKIQHLKKIQGLLICLLESIFKLTDDKKY